MLIAYKLLNSY